MENNYRELEQGAVVGRDHFNFPNNKGYAIERVLGHGNYSITYLATTLSQLEIPRIDIKEGKQVVVKEFFPNGFYCCPGFHERFLDEAQDVASCQHPQVVKILDWFRDNETVYYVTEYMEGCSLKEWIKEHGALSETEAFGYIRQVAFALSYIHKKGIMHLDLKPGNIFRKPDGTVVLIDFGRFKLHSRSMIREYYYDPGGHIDPIIAPFNSEGFSDAGFDNDCGDTYINYGADIRALGLTLWALLTGGNILPGNSFGWIPPLPENMSKVSQEIIKKTCAVEGRPQKMKYCPQNVEAFLALLDKGIKAKWERIFERFRRQVNY
jgi:serine/threonine protein kinase